MGRGLLLDWAWSAPVEKKMQRAQGNGMDTCRAGHGKTDRHLHVGARFRFMPRTFCG